MYKYNYELSLWKKIYDGYNFTNIQARDLVKDNIYFLSISNSINIPIYYQKTVTENEKDYYYFIYISNGKVEIKKYDSILKIKKYNSLFHEKKIKIIGANNLQSDGQAYDIHYIPNANGTSQLTFKLVSKYIDNITGEFRHNENIDLVKEESILKLKIFNEWYEYIVKTVTQKHNKKELIFEYSCNDLYTEELNRQGYTLNFQEEQAVGNIDELTERVLDGTEWKYKKVYSSDIELEKEPFQETVTTVKKDNQNNIYYENDIPVKETNIKKSDKYVWNSVLNKMVRDCGIHDNKHIYNYDTITNIGVGSCVNLLNNTENFTDVSFWEGYNNDNKPVSFSSEININNNKDVYLKLSGGTIFVNNSLTYNNNALKSGNKYVLDIVLTNKTSSLVKIAGYTLNNNILEEKQTIWTKNDLIQAAKYTLIFEKDEKIFDRIGITIGNNINIKSIALFELIPKEDKTVFSESLPKIYYDSEAEEFYQNYLKPNDYTSIIDPYTQIKTNYFYLDENNNEKSINGTNIKPIQTSRKIRTLTSSKSNRMSLIEDITNLFEAYPIFTIEHDEYGNILTDNNGSPKKYLTFIEKGTYKNPKARISYSNNLSSIERKYDTSDIITKLYVENYDLNDDLITISTAINNPLGENYILNLDYYANHNIISADEYYKDIYGQIGKTNLNYSYNLYGLNKAISNLSSQISIYEMNIYYWENLRDNWYTAIINTSNNKIEVSSGEPYEGFYAAMRANANDAQNKIVEINTKISEVKNELKQMRENLKCAKSTKNKLVSIFEGKYSEYIKEGIWSDNTSINSDDYYNKAETTLADAAQPKISYNIKVVDLGAILSNYIYNINDTIEVIDPEFFGYNRYGVPNAEKLLITAIDYNLDKPQNNVLTIKNYKDSFEDIFQRMGRSIAQA